MTRLNRQVYDQIASRFAAMHAEMTPRLAGSAERFLRLTVPSPRLLDRGCGPGRDLEWLHYFAHKPWGDFEKSDSSYNLGDSDIAVPDSIQETHP